MFDDARRPWRRLFLLVLILFAGQMFGQAPQLTTVSDTVYQADGIPAQGVLLISWPEFTTAGGQAVAAGSTSVTLGPGGALSVSLVPNANANPANSLYTVVYQLSDGTSKTEYWSVPTTSPANLAAVRVTLGATTPTAQIATQQYVQSAVAGKANDSAVVHLSGTETITGTKQFTASPSLPTPVQPSDAANKQYVDNSVQNTGSGSYLSLSGGTMLGPLLLSSDPASSQQAATKHYSDMWAATKADVIGGYVPPAELGSGTAGPSTCLLGNQTWGPCAAGGSSSYINGTLVANPNFNSTTPSAQSNFLNCTFENAAGDVSLECPYGNTASSFALGSQAVLNNQANTYGAGLQDFSAAGLKLPTGAGYTPTAAGAIGFDSTANMPVINVNGLTQQLALTTSNISGQASTALALAATPAQCNGSFATGIQANGNANCSTADVLELAETSQPAGIPNYGIFWFDSATHTPRVIDNNGQVVQLGLTNVFNTDANTLEEYNGTMPQTFNVYGTRTDASDYERLRLAYDTTDGYFFVGADAAGTGTQRGLGLWLQGSLRWVVDSGFNFKPWSDNLKDIGTSTLRVHNLYLGTGLVFGSGTLTGVHGTSGTALEASTVGTTAGSPFCNDGNGNATDTGCPSGGAVGSVFGRVGAVTAQTGDYSVSQVSGAAPIASPVFTGTPTAPNPATSDNSTKIATTAFTQTLIGNTVSALNTSMQSEFSLLAPLASPVLTGVPTAPTPATGDNSNTIATTAFVKNQGYGAGGGMPSGVQAEKLVNTNGGTSYATSAAGGLDAKQFICSDAFNCIQQATNSSVIASGGEVDATGYVTAQNTTSNLTISANNVTVHWGPTTFNMAAGSTIAVTGNNVTFLVNGTTFNGSAGTSTTPVIQWSGTGGRILGNFTIIGNAYSLGNGTAYGADALRATGAHDLKVDGLTVLQAGAHAIEIINSNRTRVTNFKVVQSMGACYNVNATDFNGPYYGNVLDGYDFSECDMGLMTITGGSGVYGINVIASAGWNQLKDGKILHGSLRNNSSCTPGTYCTDDGVSNVCNLQNMVANGLGVGPQTTGCGGTQINSKPVNYEFGDYTARNTGTECLAIAGYGHNIHDIDEAYCSVNQTGAPVAGSGCLAMFMGGSTNTLPGTASVSTSSAIVTGSVSGANQTYFNESLVGLTVLINNLVAGTIQSVNVAAQTMTLTANSLVSASGAVGINRLTNGNITVSNFRCTDSGYGLAFELGQEATYDGNLFQDADIRGFVVTPQQNKTLVGLRFLNASESNNAHPCNGLGTVSVDGSGNVTGSNTQFTQNDIGIDLVVNGTDEGNIVSVASATSAITTNHIVASGGYTMNRLCRVATSNVNLSGLDFNPANVATPFAYVPSTQNAQYSGTFALSGYQGFIGTGATASSALQSVGGFISGSGTTPNVVTGPASAVTGDIVTFNGTNGTAVQDSGTALGSLATLVSPVFTGTPSAPTPGFGDSSNKLATTAYVQAQTTSLPWFTQPLSNGNGITLSSTANKAYLYGVVLDHPVTTTQVTYYVVATDSSANNYDIGIYQGAAGSVDTLVTHIGSTAGTSFAASTGWKTLNWTSPVTLQPGRYYLAITSSCTSSCAQIGSGSTNTGFTFDYNNALGVANGGTLPASITGPSDNYTVASIPVWAIH